MKRGAMLFFGLVLPLFSYANVYDNSLVTNPDTTQTETFNCNLSGNSLQGASSISACADFFWSLEGTVFNTSHLQMFTKTGFTDHGYYLDITGTYCNAGCDSNPQIVGWYQRGTYASAGTTTVQVCPPSVNPTYTYMREDETGTKYCYQPFSLEQNSNCETSGVLPYTLGQPNQVCMVMDDESRCSYTLTEENGTQFYEPTIEPLTCYDNTPEYNEPNLTGTPDPDCSDLGGGVIACLENPDNVCDSQGNCQSGCGTVGVNGQEYFVCLSDDTDNDGIGDYVDPDIDGDGIRNEDDLDADGDGKDDVNYNNNGSQSGDVVVNVPAPIVNVDGGATASEIASVLTEQGDFDVSALDTLLETSSTDAINNAVNFVGSDATNLLDNVTASNASGTLDSVTSILTSGQCTNFTIPLANSELDICQHAPKVQTFLYILFALSTAWYCFHRILQTARES